MLLSLLSGQRIQILQHVKVDNIAFTERVCMKYTLIPYLKQQDREDI